MTHKGLPSDLGEKVTDLRERETVVVELIAGGVEGIEVNSNEGEVLSRDAIIDAKRNAE